MVPFRKINHFDDEAPPSSGPPTLRSARFEVAPVAAQIEPSTYPSEAPPSEDGYMPILERSDVIQAIRPRPAPVVPELLGDEDEVNSTELCDEDLELLFDEDPIFDLGEPDTERTIAIDDFDTEPPPATLRCPG